MAVDTTVTPDAAAIPTRKEKGRGLFSTYWRRFRKHGIATFGLVLLILLLIMAFVLPFKGLTIPFINAKILEITPIVPRPELDPLRMILDKNMPPSSEHIMGTDALGLDLWANIVNGAGNSLTVGFVATIVACVIGTIAGMVAGYFGGWVDTLVMRIADIFLAVPLLLFLLMATRFLIDPKNPGVNSVFQLAVIIGILEWAPVSRLVRSVTLSIKEQDFILAARAVGQRPFPIIFRHVMPNALNPVIVAGTLFVASNIVLEAFLGFLGFGVQPPEVSWGTTLARAQEEFPNGNWWWGTFPGLFILLTVLAINFIGDGLRDALDPRTLL